MKLFARTPSRDPSRIRSGLRHLCKELAKLLGDELESVIVYGSFVRTGDLESEHDVANLMLVVRSANYQTLDKIAGPITHAEKEIPLSTMILTSEDLHSSCDVFPIKFHDMKMHHRVLMGEEVFSNLQISDAHLRLRCEQRLKNLMLRMRAEYLRHLGSNQLLFDVLMEANRKFLYDMHACLVVKTGIAPEENVDLATAYGDEFGLNADVVNEILNLRKEGDIPNLGDLKSKFGCLMQLVHDSALAVDRLEVKA
jgi:predicted nucleotidyltransferase